MRTSLLIAFAAATPAAAQVHTWTNPLGGAWTDPGNWTPGSPNGASHTALLSAPGAYTVSLGSLVTLQGLQSFNPDITLDLVPGGKLRIRQDGLQFPGTIRLTGTNAAQTDIVFEVAALLTGPGGRINLLGSTGFTAVLGSSATITIDSGFTIAGGRGSLQGPRINNGLILAEGPGDAILELGGTTTNNTLIKAVPGGRLQVRDAVVSQTLAAEILAEGAFVDFLGNTIVNGGTIRSTSGGTVTIAALASTLTFNGVSFAGPIGVRGGFMQVNSGGLSVVKGGTLIINDNQTSGGTLTFASPGTLNGPGTVLLNGPLNVNATLTGPFTTGLTLGPTARVAGTGRFNGRINVGGRIAPGPVAGGVGSITFAGPILMQAAGILDFEVAGETSTEADRLVTTSANGDFTAGGTLRIRTANSYVPPAGLSWVVVLADAITGSFATLDLPAPAGGVAWSAAIVGQEVVVSTVAVPACYADCDGVGGLTANDFLCFLTRFAQADTYANCDNSTTPPVLSANDFVCFLNAYVGGCS